MIADLRIKIELFDEWDTYLPQLRRTIDDLRGRGEPLSARHVWYEGPEARITFGDGVTHATYGGSLLYLCQGLFQWRVQHAPSFRWAGESVWQTPDLVITTDAGMVTVVLEFSPPRTIRGTQEQLDREAERLLRFTAEAYLARCPELSEATDMPWLDRASRRT